MPYIRLAVTPSITRAQKAEVVRRFTQALVEVYGKQPEHVHVVIEEVAQENWGYAGQLTDEWRKDQSS
ncbi:MAG TPA: 4-oxalocrotonate tautomerase family protein [Allosphingosinicella sp.]|nr:4-oxalocrotonate tautomerase family protein [Allosphingosinicella sp.]